MKKLARRQVSGKPDAPYAGVCFTSRNACVSGTANCSDHGRCMQVGLSANCWTCSCNATLSNGLTTTWAGGACEKQDISTEFHLFFWSSLVLIGLVTAAIGMLYSASQVDMGSVLGATGYVK